MTKAKQVFISHAKEDAQFAHRLADDLRRLGVQVWIAPESIRPGESWVDAIERGLGESSHTVIVLTPKALKSRWVKKETGVAIAQERKGHIQVIPLDVEPCAVPLLLSSYQMVSFRHDYDAGLSQLADILGLHVTPPEPAHPPLVEPVAVATEEALPFWRKVPLWGWGAVGGLILLTVVGGILLAGRGPKATPTLAPIAEVPTPVFSDLSYSPNELLPGEAVAIWVDVAVADQNTPVAYTWSTEGGKIMRGQGTAAIIYKAPDTPDTYGVSLKIEYGDWDTERSASIVVVSPTPMPTPLPPTDTPTPVPTPRPPTATPTPTVALPVWAGTPVPRPVAAISPDNAAQVVQLARLGKKTVAEVTWSPDGRLLAVASGDIYLYDAQTLEELRSIENVYSLESVVFSPDGKMLASGGKVRLWQVSDGSLLRTLEGLTDWVTSVAFSPDGETLALGSREVQFCRVSDGSLLRTLEGHTDWVHSVAFSPDGATLASGSGREAWLWRVSDGTLLRTLEGHASWVNSVAFSPDGAMLASGSSDDTVRLWQVSNGTLLRMLTGHTLYVSSVAFSPDGAILASGSSDKTMRLWRVSDGTLLRILEGHTGNVASVAFSPDGATLASGSWDGAVRLWGVATD
jgi:WD40 repeat protein